MSGPWDRPSPDREPPASNEDAAPERPDAGQPPGEAWPSSDLWSDQRAENASGWDDWSTLRAPDDFVLDEPASTLGDPWAESWADETPARADAEDRWASSPDAPAIEEVDRGAPADEPASWTPSAADTGWAAAPATDEGWTSPVEPAETDWSTPAPAARQEPEPAAWQPEPEAAAWQPEPEPEPEQPAWQAEAVADPWASAASAEPPVAEAAEPIPHVAPWQTSDDPWGAVVEPAATPVAETPGGDEPMPEAPAIDEAATSVGPTAEAAAEAESEATATTGGWRRDLLPAWLTGRSAAAVPDAIEPDEAAATAEPSASAEAPAAAEPTDAVSSAQDAETGTEDGVPDGIDHPGEPVAASTEPMVADAGWAPGIETVPEASPVEPTAREDDADAAAELETPATTVTDAWPAADIGAGDASVPAPTDVTGLEGDVEGEAGNRRFDAFIGTPVIGAAAAADVGEEPVDAPVADEPTDGEGEVAAAVEPEPAALEAVVPAAEAPQAEPVETPDLAPAWGAPHDAATDATAEPEVTEPETAASEPDVEAWVAEPEAWEPPEQPAVPFAAAAVASSDAPSAAPAPAEGEAEAEAPRDPAETWRAAAAAAAAAAVVRTPDAGITSPEVATEGPPAGADAGLRPGDHQPTWRPEWLPDVEELEADERTSVLPTDWTPPPAPVQPVDRSSLAPHATPARTRPAAEADRDLDEDAEPDATTAEQAVPWLIGFILLLAGMVIVLLALIFAGDASLGGGSGEPTPQPSLAGAAVGTPPPESASPRPSASISATPEATASAAPSAAPTEAAIGGPQYGPIEMVYQGRSAALAPIYLLHREFSTQPEPEVLAQDPNLDLRRYAWAMDGTRGAGLYANLMVTVEPGVEKRQLADEISAVAFGPTADTVYAVRIGHDGGNDVAVVTAIDYASGEATQVARITYPRATTDSRTPLRDAQFEDDGGPVRLYWMEDSQLRVSVHGAGVWEVDPGDGQVTETDPGLPVLWSPDGQNRIEISETDGTTTLTRIDMDGDARGTTTVQGLVSHLRWSPESDRVVFTLGRNASGGGVLQDLFLWDLGEEPPTQITATGAAFGAEWKGARVRWRGTSG